MKDSLHDKHDGRTRLADALPAGPERERIERDLGGLAAQVVGSRKSPAPRAVLGRVPRYLLGLLQGASPKVAARAAVHVASHIAGSAKPGTRAPSLDCIEHTRRENLGVAQAPASE